MLFLSALIPLFLSTLVTASPTASSVGQLQCNDQHSNSGFLSLNGQYIEPDPTMRATSKDPYVFYSDGDGYGSGDGGGNTYNYACNSTYYKASTKDGLYRKLGEGEATQVAPSLLWHSRLTKHCIQIVLFFFWVASFFSSSQSFLLFMNSHRLRVRRPSQTYQHFRVRHWSLYWFFKEDGRSQESEVCSQRREWKEKQEDLSFPRPFFSFLSLLDWPCFLLLILASTFFYCLPTAFLPQDSSQIGQFWIESDGILKLVGPSNLPVTKGKKGPGYNFYKENNQLVARYEKNFVASLTVKWELPISWEKERRKKTQRFSKPLDLLTLFHVLFAHFLSPLKHLRESIETSLGPSTRRQFLTICSMETWNPLDSLSLSLSPPAVSVDSLSLLNFAILMCFPSRCSLFAKVEAFRGSM